MTCEPESLQSDTPCHCWEKLQLNLAKVGLKLTAYNVYEPTTLQAKRVLPLARLDGKKLKASEVKNVEMNFCPWCGTRYEISAPQ